MASVAFPVFANMFSKKTEKLRISIMNHDSYENEFIRKLTCEKLVVDENERYYCPFIQMLQ